jgi:hypothetical protein
VVAASSVVAGAGLVLASAAPVGPGPDVLGGVGVSRDQVHEQAPDLRYREVDHVWVVVAAAPFVAWAFTAASQARASIDKVMWAYQAR